MTIHTLDIEIDGKPLKALPGSMIIEVADQAGIPIPRFCYHKKLSIAANCRMCLVDVAKSPKPLPACATPVTAGMRIFTQSDKAKDAQKSVMEFLLINHPLDCPICDQGGACELQDLSLIYGNDVSQYTEKKRAVKDENLGSLVATEMTRCIQCTRCVRFGQEIAGRTELGTLGRGDRMEIGTYLKNQALTSELSGNVIDLCPVGALTSKPFRFTARAWELTAHTSIAPHDALGSHISVHTRQGKVMRVVPKENEKINETWLSDRDRFSYQGLYSKNRLKTPLIKKQNSWTEVSWEEALHTVSVRLKAFAPQDQALLASPNLTLEEFYLAQKWFREQGGLHIDHRLRQTDAVRDQASFPLMPSLGLTLDAIPSQDLIIIVGSHIQHEHPLIAHKIRKAFLQGAKIAYVNSLDVDFAFDCAEKRIVPPSHIKALWAEPTLFASLVDQSTNIFILLGDQAFNHPEASDIRAAIDQWIAHHQTLSKTVTVAYLPVGANHAGAWISGFLPHREPMGQGLASVGYTALQALQARLKAYILCEIDPLLDTAWPVLAAKALKNADCVIAFSAFGHQSLLDYADVILPTAIFTENEGTYINTQGDWQSFKAVSTAEGQARPLWKILRLLGHFNYRVIDNVYQEIKHLFDHKKHFTPAPRPAMHHKQANPLSLDKNKIDKDKKDKLEMIFEWPIYRTDSLVRESTALQASPLAQTQPACVRVNGRTAAKNPLFQTNPALTGFAFIIDERIPDGCVWIPGGFHQTPAFCLHSVPFLENDRPC